MSRLEATSKQIPKEYSINYLLMILIWITNSQVQDINIPFSN